MDHKPLASEDGGMNIGNNKDGIGDHYKYKVPWGKENGGVLDVTFSERHWK